jgi:hypothetical protein
VAESATTTNPHTFFLPKIAPVLELPSAVVQLHATIPAMHTWPPGLVAMVLGGDLLYGAGPCPSQWHYFYRAVAMHKEFDVPHILPSVCMTNMGLVAAFGRVIALFQCTSFVPELQGIWTRAPKTSS